MPTEPPALPELVAGRRGLTVVGDVHGDFVQLMGVVDAARARDHALLFLGDVLNRGPYSIPCVAVVRRLIEAGEALALPGNHEVRARLYLTGGEMNAKDRDRTRGLIAEVEGRPGARDELARFVDLLDRGPIWARLGAHAFAHAAVPAALLARAPVAFGAYVRAADGDLDRAIDGERQPDGSCTYAWLDDLPAGLTVAIGHDVQPPGAAPTRTGRRGAVMHHLDFGCGRTGGPIRTLDIPRTSLTAESSHERAELVTD